MSKAFKWPKLPNSRPYLDKGYTSIQMREYALKCIGEAIRNKQWEGLNNDEIKKFLELPIERDLPKFIQYLESVLKEKNCGQ